MKRIISYFEIVPLQSTSIKVKYLSYSLGDEPAKVFLKKFIASDWLNAPLPSLSYLGQIWFTKLVHLSSTPLADEGDGDPAYIDMEILRDVSEFFYRRRK